MAETRVWSPLFDLEKDVRSVLERFGNWPSEQAFRPLTDITREEGSIKVTAELPGMDPGDITVSVEGDALLIQGEKREEREAREEDRVVRERRFGRFERRLPLPDGVDPDRISAAYSNGVLTVTIPAPSEEALAPKRIPVQTGAA